MALIYQKSAADNTCITATRQGVGRPFNFPANWLEVRIGMFFSGVSGTNDNLAGVNENVAVVTNSDLITFGFINADATVIPGYTGTSFFGVSTPAGSNSAFDVGDGRIYGGTATALAYATMKDVTLTRSTIGALSYLAITDPALAASYAFGVVLRATIQNYGLATQTVTLQLAAGAMTPITPTDYSIASLRERMNTFPSPYPASPAMAWNDGVSAYALPMAWWIYLPFYNNRLRLSCMEALQYA